MFHHAYISVPLSGPAMWVPQCLSLASALCLQRHVFCACCSVVWRLPHFFRLGSNLHDFSACSTSSSILLPHTHPRFLTPRAPPKLLTATSSQLRSSLCSLTCEKRRPPSVSATAQRQANVHSRRRGYNQTRGLVDTSLPSWHICLCARTLVYACASPLRRGALSVCRRIGGAVPPLPA